MLIGNVIIHLFIFIVFLALAIFLNNLYVYLLCKMKRKFSKKKKNCIIILLSVRKFMIKWKCESLNMLESVIRCKRS